MKNTPNLYYSSASLLVDNGVLAVDGCLHLSFCFFKQMDNSHCKSGNHTTTLVFRGCKQRFFVFNSTSANKCKL